VGQVWRALLIVAVLAACGDAESDGRRIAEVTVTTDDDRVGGTRGDAASLGRAAGGADGRSYTVRAATSPGVVIGKVGGGVPRDTSITPTHDLGVCRPFTESLVRSRNGGVGNAVVWLLGVSEGPRDDAPRRVRLTLDGCRLEPRVQRIAQGGTVMISGRDAMMSRLQFVALGERTSRATVRLSDVGQMVPTAAPTETPGLVQVYDDLHPWVRAYLVVGPHPFVAVTDTDGAFRFDGVPPGRYTMIVWHERLGVKRQGVKVEGAVQTNVAVDY
jgi:hypothetical protein